MLQLFNPHCEQLSFEKYEKMIRKNPKKCWLDMFWAVVNMKYVYKHLYQIDVHIWKIRAISDTMYDICSF